MPQCAFKNCVNNHRNSKVSEGVSFFRFPTDPLRYAEWISVVVQERGEESYKPKRNSKICSIHFNNDDISGNNERRRLAKTAVPNLILVHQKNVEAPILSQLTTSNTAAPSTNENNTTVPIRVKTPPVSISPNSPALLSLRNEYLLKKLSASRKILDTKTKQIRNLRKVNKRLRKNNSRLKNIVNVLKNKICR